MQTARGLLMSGNNIPVLKLDIDEENIRRLDEISEKFKAAFAIGPGGFPVSNPPPEKRIPGNNNQPQQPKDAPVLADNGRLRDEKGRYLAQGGESGNPGKGKKPGEDGGGKFLSELSKFAKEAKKDFDQVNKTLKQTNSQLGSLFKNTISWGVRLSLLSGGGLFGYDMFAAHAAKQYTTAQELNMTTGQMQAAKNVYGTRFAGNDAIMNALTKAQSDGTSQEAKALYGMGLNPSDGAAANLPKVYSKAAEIIAGMKGTGLSQAALNARGLGSLGFDTQTANQTKANADQLPRLANQYEGTAKSLDMSAGTQRSWQDITTTFDNNLDHISNTLSTKLASLNGPIGRLSTDITNAVDAFISGPNGTAVFNMISDGLTDFADWLASPQFKTDLEDFSTKVQKIVKAIGEAVDWIYNHIPNLDKPSIMRDANNAVGDAGASSGRWVRDELREHGFKLNWWTFPDERQGIEQHAQSARVIAASLISRIPNGMLDAVVNRESGGNPFAVSPKGAMGPGQFMPDTARRYGLKGNDVFDPEKVREAMTRYFSDNLTRYHGDISESLAQYNGGNKAVMQGDVLNMKMETVKYLMSILPKVEGAVAQHPQLMQQLANAQQYLSTQPKDARVQIHLEQTPGADVGLSVKSQGVRLPPNAFVIPG